MLFASNLDMSKFYADDLIGGNLRGLDIRICGIFFAEPTFCRTVGLGGVEGYSSRDRNPQPVLIDRPANAGSDHCFLLKPLRPASTDRGLVAGRMLDCSASGIEHKDIAEKDCRAAEGEARIDVQALEYNGDGYGNDRNNG